MDTVTTALVDYTALLVEEHFEKLSNLPQHGRLLQEFKDETRAGDWGPLLKRLGWSHCDRFVRTYRVFGDNKALLSAANLRHIPQSGIFLLAKPSTPWRWTLQ
jgi:hypothetical protein